MVAVPCIPLAHFLPKGGIADEAYVTACESLAVGLAKSGVVKLQLAPHEGDALQHGLFALLDSGTQALPGCELREWRAGGAAGRSASIESVGAGCCAPAGCRGLLRCKHFGCCAGACCTHKTSCSSTTPPLHALS